jgi:5-methylcytosine-specific restriction endonuclease McrA
MKKHTKIYLEFFGYDISDFIPCEMCGSKSTDIHHIEARGMGGSKLKDNIENLQALCRPCHILYGDKKQYKELLKTVHLVKMNKRK